MARFYRFYPEESAGTGEMGEDAVYPACIDPHPEQDGVTWREAKKQLRQYYLDKAAAVRQLRESDVA